jgi:hypothetical protein
MVQLKKVIIFLFFIIGITNNTFAQVVADLTPNVVNQVTPSKNDLIEKQNELLKQKVLELKIKNESMTEFHSSLLSTVYWSLGFLGSIAALLIGFGWWSNFKIHENDKEGIKTDVNSLISEFESSWNSGVSEFRRLDSLRIEQQIGEIKTYIDNKINETQSEIKDINKIIKELQANQLTQNSQLTNYIEIFDKSIHQQEYNLRVAEAVIWEIKGLYGNVLITRTQALYKACDIGGNQVEIALFATKDTLEEMIKNGFSTKKYGYDRLKDILNTIKNQDVLIGSILSLLEKIKVDPE